MYNGSYAKAQDSFTETSLLGTHSKVSAELSVAVRRHDDVAGVVFDDTDGAITGRERPNAFVGGFRSEAGANDAVSAVDDARTSNADDENFMVVVTSAS